MDATHLGQGISIQWVESEEEAGKYDLFVHNNSGGVLRFFMCYALPGHNPYSYYHPSGIEPGVSHKLRALESQAFVDLRPTDNMVANWQELHAISFHPTQGLIQRGRA